MVTLIKERLAVPVGAGKSSGPAWFEPVPIRVRDVLSFRRLPVPQAVAGEEMVKITLRHGIRI